MQRVRVFILLLMLGPIMTGTADGADQRVALVIGNSAYQHTSTLANPRHDAADFAAALKKVGFNVIEGRDLDKSAMDLTIRQFARELGGAHVGLFFYAGHGLQVDGQNYLVPVDARLEDASGLDFEMVRLDLVHKTMERATKTNLIFLDACRDNPLSRNLARALGTRSAAIGKGLAAVESGEGTLISFSTQPGSLAADGTGRNSPYAGAVLKQLADPRDDISTMLIGVRNQVIQETARRQVPWEHSALTARFYFVAPDVAPTAEPPRPVQSYEQQAELAFWASVKDSRDAAVIQTYVDRFPSGTFAALARVMVERLKASAVRQATAPAWDEGGKPGAVKAPDARVTAVPAPSTPAPTLPPDTKALARDLQKELKRVGCDPGAADGSWGAKAKGALGEFAKRVNVALATDAPTPAALEAVSGRKERVCPLVCAAGQLEAEGKCVAKPQARPETRRAEQVKRRPPAEQSAKSKPGFGGSGMCWSATPNASSGYFVPCSDPRAAGKAF